MFLAARDPQVAETNSLYPPLQKYARLEHRCAAEGVTPELEAFVEVWSATATQVELLEKKVPGLRVDSTLRHRIISRGAQLLNDCRAKAQTELKKASVLFSDGARGGDADMTSGRVFAQLSPAQLTTTLSTPSVDGVRRNRLTFRTLSAVAPIAAAAITLLRGHFDSGAGNLCDVARKHVDWLASQQPQKCAWTPFAALEVYRHYVAFVFGTGVPGAITRIRGLPVGRHLEEAVCVIEELSAYMAYVQQLQQATTQIMELHNMCLQLLQEYSIFFNTTLAFVDGLHSDYLAFASSFYPSDAAFYGAVRFPCVLRVLFKKQTRAAGLQLRSVRNHFSGVTLKAVTTAIAVGPSPTVVLPTLTADFVQCFRSVVEGVIAPVETFSAFLLLSAAASLSPTSFLTSTTGVCEVQCLYEGCPSLVALAKAAGRGDLGAVWAEARQGAAAYLSNDPLITESVRDRLLDDVLAAVCFQYFGVRECTDCARAAEVLHLSNAHEVMSVAESLIRTKRLSAQIDAVNSTISLCVSATVSDTSRSLRETVRRSTVELDKMELRARLLEVHRSITALSTFQAELKHRPGGGRREP